MDSCINLFIVEDHKIVRDGIRAMLMGINNIKFVGEAANGGDFLRNLEKQQPDVVILDIGLPDISGIEICKKLNSDFPEIKIIILTANTDEDSIIESVKYGASGFLSKDVSKEELLEAIHTVNGGKEYFSDSISQIIYSGYIGALRGKQKNEKKPLTTRETEVIKLISEGLSYKEIADKLFISSRTVETHRNNILEKLELKNNIEIVKYAIKNKMTDLD